MIAALFFWGMREGLVPVIASVIWPLMVVPLLLEYIVQLPSQSTEATHRKCKSRHKPRNNQEWHDEEPCVSSICTSQLAGTSSKLVDDKRHYWAQDTSYYLYHCLTILTNECNTYASTAVAAGCWNELLQQHHYVFGMRNHCTIKHAGKPAPREAQQSTTFSIPQSRKRGVWARRKHGSGNRWTRLLFLLGFTIVHGPDCSLDSGNSFLSHG